MAPNKTSAIEFVNECRSASPGRIPELRACSQWCKGCDLYRRATQTVFGEGSDSARLMLVGEQPGDQEDLSGRPFVGLAGRLLDECLAEAGIDRASAYLTNAVKHFKWLGEGTRRLHAKPSRGEVVACKPWLEAEIEELRPKLIVCLGSTAAQSLLGPEFKLMGQRGKVLPFGQNRSILATLHPCAVLRMPSPAARHEARRTLIADLLTAQGLMTTIA